MQKCIVGRLAQLARAFPFTARKRIETRKGSQVRVLYRLFQVKHPTRWAFSSVGKNFSMTRKRSLVRVQQGSLHFG